MTAWTLFVCIHAGSMGCTHMTTIRDMTLDDCVKAVQSARLTPKDSAYCRPTVKGDPK